MAIIQLQKRFGKVQKLYLVANEIASDRQPFIFTEIT